MDPISIVFEEAKSRSVAYANGKQVGECEFRVTDIAWVITHTGVRTAYGGQGIAGQLMEKVIEEARARQVKILVFAQKKLIHRNQRQKLLFLLLLSLFRNPRNVGHSMHLPESDAPPLVRTPRGSHSSRCVFTL